jgi:hypothetical protein
MKLTGAGLAARTPGKNGPVTGYTLTLQFDEGRTHAISFARDADALELAANLERLGAEILRAARARPANIPR